MNRQLVISFLMLVSLLAVLPASVSADAWVTDATPVLDIYAAIDNAATNGGTVFFAAGEYYVNIVIDTPATSFALKGEGIEESKLYSAGGGSVITVVNTGASVVTIEGFRICEGTGDISNYAASCGGGLYSNYANLVVAFCKFQNNDAYYGGGMYNENYTNNGTYSNSGYPSYTVVVCDCQFEDNVAEYGGGMYNYMAESVTVTRCIFEENYADEYDGGGMYNDNSNVTVNRCTFERNDAYYNGGGMANYYSGTTAAFPSDGAAFGIEGQIEDEQTVTLSNCLFTGNEAENGNGGGMYNDWSTVCLTRCAFEDNVAYDYGGAMDNEVSTVTVASSRFVGNVAPYAGGMENLYSDVTVTNSIFTGNCATGDLGGAVYNDYIFEYNTVTFTNCTLTGNEATYGGAMMIDDNYYPENIGITNCILWGNGTEIVLYSERLPASYGMPEMSSNGPVVTYSDVQGGYPGVGNIDADPLFVNAPNDVSLLISSPCIDAGTNASWESLGDVVDDIIGTPRPQMSAYDMGAYEHIGSSFSPVIIQPLARTQLQSIVALWTDLSGRLPDEPDDGMAALIAQIQTHVANAAQLTNPIYAAGQLSAAVNLMQQLAALLA